MKAKILKVNPIIIISLFFIIYYMPLLIMVIFSFNNIDPRGNPNAWAGGLSLQHYVNLFSDPVIREVVFFTIRIAVMATFVSVFIGTLAAIALTKTGKKFRTTTLQVNNFPVINPEIVTAIGFVLLFIAIGVQRGATTMLIAHIAFCIPYVIITVYPKLRSLDENTVEAAMDLGAKPMMAIRKVIFPQIKDAIFAAGAIAFAMSFDDFVISLFTAGSRRNISTFIYSRAHRPDLTFNALSAIIMLIIVVKIVGDIILINLRKQEKKV